MKLLVTGGAGFIGSHIVEQALAVRSAGLPNGLQVAVLDDLSSGSLTNLPAGVPLFRADVRDRQAVLEVFEQFRPDVVSHQAAQVSVSLSVRDPLLDAGVNVLGGLNVLSAAVATGVQRVVFASSGGAIYGEVPDGHAAGEDDPKNPFSPYATSKLASELYLETYRRQYGLQSVVLRYANVYGPRQNPHGEAGVVAIFARRLLAGQALVIHAGQGGEPGGCVRDYVYVSDVARANLAAILGTLPQQVYNVGTGVGRSTLEVAQALVAALEALSRPTGPASAGPLPAGSLPAGSLTAGSLTSGPFRAGDLQRSVLDPARLHAVLGGALPFEEGVAQTARWFAGGPHTVLPVSDL